MNSIKQNSFDIVYNRLARLLLIMNLKATFTPINKKKPQKRQNELNHRHYLEGFQHIERSIDLAYDKLIFTKPHSYDR